MNLRQARLRSGMTQEALSEKSGVHRVMIGRYESGDSKPSYDTLVKLARALDTSVDELIKEPTDQTA